MSGLIKGVVEKSTPDVYAEGDVAPVLVDVNGRTLTSIGGVVPALGVDNADAQAVSALVDKLIVMSRAQVFDRAAGDYNRADAAAGDFLVGDNLPGVGLMVHEGAGLWNRLAAPSFLGDGVTPNTALSVGLYTFNGVTFDRLRSEGNDRDGIAVETLGSLQTLGFLHGFNGSSGDWDRLKTAETGDVSSGVGVLAAHIYGRDEITAASIRLIAAGDNVDAVAAVTISRLLTITRNTLFNGTTFDRQRNNIEEIPLASAARTASTNSPDQTNFNGETIEVTLEVSVNPGGAETLQLVIEGKTSAGTFYTIATATADAFGGSTGVQTLTVGPGVSEASEAANGSSFAGTMVKRTWRARVVHSAAGSWTYLVDSSINN